MSTAPRRRFVIHPSLDSLVQRIEALGTSTTAAEIAALREACREKIRSFPLENWLRQATDRVAARERWDRVASFAGGAPAGGRP